MNEKLIELYQSNWNNLSEELNAIINDSSKEVKPANPYLLNVNEEYNVSDIRVMIFGQETNGWEGEFQNDINVSIEIYDDFINSNKCFSYGGQFWNGYNRFLTILKNQFPNKKISSISNNVVKIGGAGSDLNCPPDYIYDIEKKHFNIIEKEIEILKPNVIIFLSGPNYDEKLKNIFLDLEFNTFSDKFNDRQLSKIEYKNLTNVFRTYHPNYLWRNNIDDYFNEIITNIKL
jgi:hypothetical protein